MPQQKRNKKSRATNRSRRASTQAAKPPPPLAAPLPDGTAPVAFVIMPFSALSDLIYNAFIKPLAERAGYRVERADTTLNQRAIMQDVVRGIENAALVIADLTGKNANVFYELGLSHVIGRPTLLLAQSTNDIPFDLKAYRTIIYTISFPDDARIETGSEAELGPVLQAAFKGEIVFSNPYRDFGTSKVAPDVDDLGPTEGILDAMARFILTDAPNATAALQRLGSEMERTTEEQAAALAAHQIDGEDPNALQTALALANDLAAVWEAASDRLESLVDIDLIPSVLGIEKDVASVIRAASHNSEVDITDFKTGLAGLAGSSVEFVDGLTSLAGTIRANSHWASALLRPGDRLASLFERTAANVEQLDAVATAAAAELGGDA